MKNLKDIALTRDQAQGLTELHNRLLAEFDVDSVILFGSVARGDADEESDIDLLVITTRPYDRPERHEITDLLFDINLRHGTNFTSLVFDRENWETGMASALPIHDEILRDGVLV